MPPNTPADTIYMETKNAKMATEMGEKGRPLTHRKWRQTTHIAFQTQRRQRGGGREDLLRKIGRAGGRITANTWKRTEPNGEKQVIDKKVNQANSRATIT